MHRYGADGEADRAERVLVYKHIIPRLTKGVFRDHDCRIGLQAWCDDGGDMRRLDVPVMHDHCEVHANAYVRLGPLRIDEISHVHCAWRLPREALERMLEMRIEVTMVDLRYACSGGCRSGTAGLAESANKAKGRA